MKFLVIQPHLDDAFFSITETAMTWVEDGHQVLLATVFGGIPRAEHVGVERELKHQVMWGEYEAAIRSGPFLHYSAGLFLDHAARSGPAPLNEIVWYLERCIRDVGADAVVCSVGIHHDDHWIVSDCMVEADLGSGEVWTYDELPYFALYPEQSMLGRSPDSRLHMEREGSRGHLTEKQAICRLFASQIGDTEERCLWVPERVWRPR